jgi:hypothetical protein
MRAPVLIAALVLALFSLSSFAPTYALTGISVNPTSVATGGTATITVTYTINTGTDIFRFLSVTDPLGNTWNYTATPFSMNSGSAPVAIAFPAVGMWTLVKAGSGPNVGGTDVPGMYHVMGTYIDEALSIRFKMLFSVSNNGNFSVPEFNQSILVLVGVMLPAMLLVRLRMHPKQPL